MRTEFHPYCRFKTELIHERSQFLCGTALEILHEMAQYCEAVGIPLMVTDSVSTEEEDVDLNRISDEHRTGRAFDVSIQGWLDVATTDFIHYFESKFMSVAAIGKQSGVPRLIFRHNNGHGDHLHVQVARVYAIKDPLSIERLG